MTNTETKSRSYGGRDPLLQAYLEQIDQIPMPEKSQEGEIAKKARKGDLEAITQLLRLNVGIVVSLAEKYKCFGAPLMDLIQEGNIGFMEAMKRYDSVNGAKLVSYAYDDIAGKMKRFLTGNKYIVGRPANRADIKFGIVYLDAPAEDYGDRRESRGRTYERTSSNEPTPYQIVARKDMLKRIRKSLRVLNGKQKELIIMRFGLDGKDERTQGEIAEKFGVSENAVSLMEKRALENLKRHMVARKEVI